MTLQDPHQVRHLFFVALWEGLQITWPILSGVLVVLIGVGGVIGLLEGWGIVNGIYFAFVSGLTIGYGDLVPKLAVTRVLAVAIGFLGIVTTGLVAALSVRALQAATALDPR